MQEQFVARARAVGASVHVVASPEEAVAQVVEIFRSAGARVAVVSPDLDSLWAPVGDALASAGAKFVEDPSPEAVAQADFGVTRSPLAVAETGSVVVAGNELFPRLATMLPLVHVVLVDAGSLVASLDDLGEFLARAASGERGEPIRYVSLVTGPSRTADVEKTLSTGVHGPRELHVIIIVPYSPRRAVCHPQ